MKYLSKEWLEAVQEKANNDEAYLKKTEGLTLKFQILVTDAPGGVDKQVAWDIEKGKIKSVILEENPAPSDWRTAPVDPDKYTFKSIAPYETYCAVHKKELSLLGAMTKGLKMSGDMAPVLSSVEEYIELQNLQADVPGEY